MAETQNDPLLPGYSFNAHLVTGLTPIEAQGYLDFFIDRPLEDLAVGGGRPLSRSTDAQKEMEAQRRPLYLAAADAVIPNKTTAADAVAAALEALDAIFVH